MLVKCVPDLPATLSDHVRYLITARVVKETHLPSMAATRRNAKSDTCRTSVGKTCSGWLGPFLVSAGWLSFHPHPS